MRRELLAALVCGQVMACAGDDVPIEATVASVKREAVVLSVQTAPDQTVFVVFDEPVQSDASGHAELTLPVPAEGDVWFDDGRVSVKAPAKGPIADLKHTIFGGGQFVGYQDVELGFNPTKLRTAPESPEGAWARFVGWRWGDRGFDGCLRLHTGDLGSGQIEPNGSPFFGPAGAKVEIGGSAFEIGDTGLGVWTPPADALFRFFTAELGRAQLPAKITVDGQPSVAFSVEVELMKGCQRNVAKAVREAVANKTELDGAAAPEHPFVLLARVEGNIVLSGARAGLPAGAAKYVAIEEDGSKAPPESCTDRRYYDKTHDELVASSKTMIDTQVTVYERPTYRQLAVRTFKPPSFECKHEVRPSERDIDRWLREVVEAQAGAAETPKSSRKRKKKR